MRALPIAVCLAAHLAAIAPLQAGDVEKGKAKAAEVCAACHGLDGVSKNPIWPHIGGQYENYLLHSLRGYANGERQNAVMQGIVNNLKDKEITDERAQREQLDELLQDLAAYYAAQPGVLYKVPSH